MKRIDLTCPAELLGVTLPGEEDQVCALTLFNLTDRTVASVEATVRLMDEKGNEREKVSHRARALNGRAHSAFPMYVPCAPAANAVRAEVTVDKVWFTDNAVWRREEGNETEYEPNDLPVSPALTNLRYLAGDTAVGFPSRQMNVWVCVCGRPNDPNDIWCARCLRDREMIFREFSPECVETRMEQKERQLDLRSRSAREDTARLQRIREEEYNQKQEVIARRRRVAVWAVCALLVTALSLGVFRPLAGLLIGTEYLKNGNLPAAETALMSAGDFPGAAEKLTECRLEQARLDAVEATEPDTLLSAEERLRASSDPADTALADNVLEKRADMLLESGDFESAEALFSLLPEARPGRQEKLNACLWARAESNREKRFFTRAREEYLALGAWPGAADRAAECLYIPAIEMIENGEYDAAEDMLLQIPDYQDSAEQIRKCRYLNALSLETQGDREGAIACYRASDGYDDAKERADALVLELAEEARVSGDQDKALELYEQLPDNPEAVTKAQDCARTLAQKAYNNAEYFRAVELTEKLPEGDSEPLKQKACYQAGKAALKQGENEKAVRLLERAGSYKDSGKQLSTARYAWAAELVEQGSAELAGEQLALLGEDCDDPQGLRTGVRYLELEREEEAGLTAPAEMAEKWLELGSYGDARERGLRIRYGLAAEAEGMGRVLDAAELYAAAAEYEDASARSEALYDAYYGQRTEEIRAALKAGDRETAITLLDSMDLTRIPEKYRELDGLKEKTVYELANSLYSAGKPYEALPWYRRIPDYRDVPDRLKRNSYLILGEWADDDGNTAAEFREDGTCRINGEELVFTVRDPANLYTAKPGEEPKLTHEIAILNATRISLIDQRVNKRITLTRKTGN